jgi:hypothetical protein
LKYEAAGRSECWWVFLVTWGTRCRSWVVSSPASFLGGPEIKSGSSDRLTWLGPFFCLLQFVLANTGW